MKIQTIQNINWQNDLMNQKSKIRPANSGKNPPVKLPMTIKTIISKIL